ncbi:MAG: sensor histidine kinase [Oscillospiraceae bacterium]|nr:sensor histidine kinase [Oscillospiraceae bacterium]
MTRIFNKLRLRFGTWSLARKIALWSVILVVPFLVISVYLLFTMNGFFSSYDRIVRNVTLANTYNIEFQEDMDMVMYQMVARALRQDELGEIVGMLTPDEMIGQARSDFETLRSGTVSLDARDRLNSLLNLLDALSGYVDEIDATVEDHGAYEVNMARLDNDFYILTDLIQERISEYIYFEANSMELVRQNLVTRLGSIVIVIIITLVLSAALAMLLTVIITKEQNRARDLELNLLQVQINPHFLYNTLDTIIWMTEDDRKEDITDIVMYLSEFFRTTLSSGRNVIRLQEEFQHVEAYLNIQAYRYRDLLRFEASLPPELRDATIIKMTLQPIVENALYHGIKNKRGGGTIRISAREDAGEICLTVSDDGVGMQEEELRQLSRAVNGLTRPKSDDSGFGLANVAERLRMRYGDRYGLQIDSRYGEGTVVTIRIPRIVSEKSELLE